MDQLGHAASLLGPLSSSPSSHLLPPPSSPATRVSSSSGVEKSKRLRHRHCQARSRFAVSAERQRAGAEKEESPRQRGGEEAASKASPEDERHDRALLPGDSGTHSVTDSYDLNSFGSYVDSDEENHEVGLSIDGDEDEEDTDGVDLDLRTIHGGGGSGHGAGGSLHAPPPTPSPEILLAFGSAHGAAAFSLHGGSNPSGHGMSGLGMSGHGASGHGLGGLGVSGHRWSAGRDSMSRHGASVHAGPGGMPRRGSWPGGMSTFDIGIDALGAGGDDCPTQDMEAGLAGGVGIGGGVGVGVERASRGDCYICCARRADAVLMECGHGGLCFTCAQQLAQTPPSQCPVCRKTIQEVLTLGGIVTVPSSNSLVGLAGGGGGEVKTPEDRPAGLVGGGVSPVGRIPGPSLNQTGAGNGGGRVGSGTFRRFSGPDVVGASSLVPGVSGQGAAQLGGGGAGEGGRAARAGSGAAAAQRAASPPAPRDFTLRDLEARGMSVEGGWLDPV